jgi:hypothetical protein
MLNFNCHAETKPATKIVTKTVSTTDSVDEAFAGNYT